MLIFKADFSRRFLDGKLRIFVERFFCFGKLKIRDVGDGGNAEAGFEVAYELLL